MWSMESRFLQDGKSRQADAARLPRAALQLFGSTGLRAISHLAAQARVRHIFFPVWHCNNGATCYS